MTRSTFRTVRWFRQHPGELLATCCCLVTILLVTATVPARAADVAVNVHEQKSTYQVHGSFTAAVPLATAWAVLSDYEHIGGFVKSMRASAFVNGPNGARLLRQDAVAGIFPFRWTMRVELKLSEEPRKRIAFRDMLGRDFERYEGAWTLHEDSSGTLVDYALDADPHSGVPHAFGRSVMAHSVRDLLTQVRQEMLRRNALTHALADTSAPR